MYYNSGTSKLSLKEGNKNSAHTLQKTIIKGIMADILMQWKWNDKRSAAKLTPSAPKPATKMVFAFK
jgi:hypothetical protein